jgi:GNAT superfamily N-acetyltransferase
MLPGDTSLPVLDRFFSGYAGCDIEKVKPGEKKVCASSRRERPELHYGDAFPVWAFLTRGRCVVSVHPALLEPVTRLVSELDPARFRDPQTVARFAAVAADVLGFDRDAGTAFGPVFVCTPEAYCGEVLHECRAVTEADRAALESARLLDSSLEMSIRDGTCFAAFEQGIPVALCGVCPVPHMGDLVADISLNGTLEQYRRRGFGRTVLSAVTRTVLDRRITPFYITSASNTASIRTAASVGYAEYGWQFRVKAPADK